MAVRRLKKEKNDSAQKQLITEPVYDYWLFDVSCGFEDCPRWASNHVNHGDEVVIVAVTTSTRPSCLEQAV